MKRVKTIENELRYDRGQIETFERGDGFLRARVSIARAGVFPYLTSSGQIRMEAKLPDDIFSDITINSAKGVPVTDGHPPIDDNKGMVSTSNWQKYVKGSLGDTVTVKDGMLDASETIFDADLIADLEAGKKVEISIGFKTDVDHTPGEYDGQRYDARQTNIRINHVAHVEKGRAGESVRAYLDSADENLAVMHFENNNTRRDSKMDPKMIIDGIKKFLLLLGFKPDESAGDGDGSGDGKTGDGKGGETEADKSAPKGDSGNEISILKNQLKSQQAKIDALEALTGKQREDKQRADEAVKIDEAVKKRLTLIDTAKSVIPDFKYDGLTDRDIMLNVIEKTLPYEKDTKLDALDDVFIAARFDAALSLAKEKANITGETMTSGRIDEAEIEKKKNQRLNMVEV